MPERHLIFSEFASGIRESLRFCIILQAVFALVCFYYVLNYVSAPKLVKRVLIFESLFDFGASLMIATGIRILKLFLLDFIKRCNTNKVEPLNLAK